MTLSFQDAMAQQTNKLCIDAKAGGRSHLKCLSETEGDGGKDAGSEMNDVSGQSARPSDSVPKAS